MRVGRHDGPRRPDAEFPRRLLQLRQQEQAEQERRDHIDGDVGLVAVDQLELIHLDTCEIPSSRQSYCTPLAGPNFPGQDFGGWAGLGSPAFSTTTSNRSRSVAARCTNARMLA